MLIARIAPDVDGRTETMTVELDRAQVEQCVPVARQHHVWRPAIPSNTPSIFRAKALRS